MSDLLKELGYSESQLKGKHLIAEGYDQDFQGVPFYVSIPIVIALDPKNEVLLAYEMNGEVLSIDHGYPLRLVVPGHSGVRNCKWLRKLTISDQEADSIF